MLGPSAVVKASSVAKALGLRLLVAAYGIGAEEALERVQRLYDTSGDQQPPLLDTELQQRRVHKSAQSAMALGRSIRPPFKCRGTLLPAKCPGRNQAWLHRAYSCFLTCMAGCEGITSGSRVLLLSGDEYLALSETFSFVRNL